MTYSRSHSQCIARSEVKMQLCLITCCFPVSTGLCSINICCTSHHIKLLGMLSRKRYTVRPWSKELINPVILNVFSIEQQSLKKCWELCYNKRARTHYRLLVTLITSWMLCMGKTWKLVGFPVWRGGIGGFVGFVQCVLRTFQSPEAAALVFLELGKDNSSVGGRFPIPACTVIGCLLEPHLCRYSVLAFAAPPVFLPRLCCQLSPALISSHLLCPCWFFSKSLHF